MLSDLKYAFRQLAKAPGFTAVAVLILALGIGANAAVFTVIDTLLLRGLPVRHPEELVVANSPGYFSASYPLYRLARRGAKSFSGFVGFSSAYRSLVATGLGRQAIGTAKTTVVSGDFFSFLGVSPSLGRILTPADDKSGAARTVAVLSDAYWKRDFGGDPNVLGKTVLIDNAPFTVVGVAPAGFLGMEVSKPTDVWVPLEADPILSPSDSVRFNAATAWDHIWIHLMGRMRSGVPLRTAQAELNVMHLAELRSDGVSESSEDMRDALDPAWITLSPAGSGYLANRDSLASLLNVLLLVVGMVLVIACANVAGLLLARSTARQREFALRAALGATRRHLLRQLLVESMMLAAVAGLLGLLVAHGGTSWLARYLPDGETLTPTIDGRILIFAALVSIITGLLVGLLPMIRLSRLSIISAIKSQASTLAGGAGQKWSQALVAAQIAISICLLAGSGLFVRTLQNLRNADLGFDSKNIALMEFGFDPAYSNVRRISLSREIQLALQQTPGVTRATFSLAGGGLMTDEDRRQDTFAVDGYPSRDPQALKAHSAFVGPGFFTTFGIPLHRGREISEADVFPPEAGRISNDVIVVNETFARKFFPHEDPLGRTVRLYSQSRRVIGVVKDTRQWDLREKGVLEIYLPATAEFQMPYELPPPALMIQLRTSGDPMALESTVRKTIAAIDPRLRPDFYTTMEKVLGQSLFQERMMAETAGLFSVFALCLASLGLYGILAYNVARRTREIGVRVALGARGGDVILLILRGGMAMTLVGCLIGASAAIALAHLIASRLYGVPPVDPVTFLATIGVLLLVAFIACWLPARRATKVDPLIALRAE